MFDPELYRPKAEVEQWKRHCPIATFEQRMKEAALLDEAQLAALEADVAQEIARAVAFAEAGTWEPAEQLERDVYTRQVSGA
jgi:TPP-dependent pyruvate/acetoin dehydrogenase alpha subunit